MDHKILEALCKVSLSMFRKNFFGIFHGSLSAKTDNKIIINKRDAIFDEMEPESFIMIYPRRDYRWNDASIDAGIHNNIYQNIPDAKFIAYGMPPFATAYALRYSRIVFKDYFSMKRFGELDIYDPKDLDNWYERAEVEIYREFKRSQKKIIVIRGYGVYVYDRDLNQMAKTIALLENACRLLYFARTMGEQYDDEMYFI